MQIGFLCRITKKYIFWAGNSKVKEIDSVFLKVSNWHKCLEQKPGKNRNKDLKTEETAHVKIKESQTWCFFGMKLHETI